VTGLEKEIESLTEALSMSEKTIEKAVARALQRTTRTFAALLAKETADGARVPVRPVRQRIKTRGRGLLASLSMITHDLPLILAGARQGARGTATRQGHFVGGAFIARGRLGRLERKVYRRLAKARHPLIAEKVALHEAASSATREIDLREVFLKNLLHEVRYRGGLLG
jgi:hypothetical protein